MVGTDLLAGGRYRVVRRLAQGGMGEVLLAEFPGDSTLAISKGYVVLKRALQEAQNRAHQTTMLREEARISLRLLHDNLVESFFLDEHEGDPILVMEFLAGRSLAQVLGLAKKNKDLVPVDVILALMRAAACGLHFAHSLTDRGRPLGLIHRDVSPANLFLTFDGRTKVIDFGVAKADDSEIRTSTGVLKGKLGYMSPEHAAGDVKLTAAADLWSLGVVMWESLMADRLFASSSPSETLRAISDKVLPSPASVRPDVARGVAQVCMRLLERDVERRIGTGAELVEAIDALPEARGLGGVDLGAFLAQRFPTEVAAGRDEATRCARMRRKTPIPMGLVKGTASAAPAEGETPTIVLRTADTRDLLRAQATPGQNTLQNALQEATLDENAPTKRLTARAGLLAEPHSLPGTPTASGEAGADDSVEVDMSTRTQRLADLGGLGATAVVDPAAGNVPRGPAATGAPGKSPTTGSRRLDSSTRQNPLTTTQQQLRRAVTSWLAVAMLTFGVLALGMGVAFSFLAPAPAASTTVFSYVDPKDGLVLVGKAQDAPAGLVATPFDLAKPMQPGAAALPPADAAALRARADASGVTLRARLPVDPRGKAAALLPLLIAAVGLLALALAIPGFVIPGRRARLMVQALLLVVALAGVGLGFQRGALGWPGRNAWQSVPHLVVNART